MRRAAVLRRAVQQLLQDNTVEGIVGDGPVWRVADGNEGEVAGAFQLQQLLYVSNRMASPRVGEKKEAAERTSEHSISVQLGHDTLLGMCKVQKETCQMTSSKPVLGCVRSYMGIGFLHTALMGVYNGSATYLISPLSG